MTPPRQPPGPPLPKAPLLSSLCASLGEEGRLISYGLRPSPKSSASLKVRWLRAERSARDPCCRARERRRASHQRRPSRTTTTTTAMPTGNIQRTSETATVMSLMGTWLTRWLIWPTSFLRGFHRSQSEAESSAHWREPAMAEPCKTPIPPLSTGSISWGTPELDAWQGSSSLTSLRRGAYGGRSQPGRSLTVTHAPRARPES